MRPIPHTPAVPLGLPAPIGRRAAQAAPPLIGAFCIMQDADNELAQAALLCKQQGYPKAALLLSKAWANELRTAKKGHRLSEPEYRPSYGGSWSRRDIDEAE